MEYSWDRQRYLSGRNRLQERKFPEHVLCGLSKENPIRKLCIWIVQLRVFKAGILVAILVNCALLGLYDPKPSGNIDMSSQSFNNVISEIEKWLLGIYTVEFVLRFVAKGFWAYFARVQNWLDFGIVAIEWTIELITFFNFIDESTSLTAVMLVRVLRPLKTMNSLPALKLLVSSLADSLQQLSQVTGLLAFVFLLFGISGCELLAGRLQQRCYNNNWGLQPLQWYIDGSDWNGRMCSNYSSGEICGTNETCRIFDNPPNDGYTSFNNIFSSFLTIFVAMTLEGWIDLLNWSEQALSKWIQLYFIILVWIGSFFMLNLAVAVIYSNFSFTRKSSTSKTFRDRKLITKVLLRWTIVYNARQSKREKQFARIQEEERLFREREYRATVTSKNRIVDFDLHDSVEQMHKIVQKEELHAFERKELAISRDASRTMWAKNAFDYEESHSEKRSRRKTKKSKVHPIQPQRSKRRRRRKQEPLTPKVVAKLIVGHWLFNTVVYLAIIFNTALLVYDHYEVTREVSRTLELLNLTLTIGFTVETVLKIYAMGFSNFVEDHFNTFDAMIVLTSWIEIVLSSENVFSSLRIFRTLRIFRLARKWRSLNSLLNNMGRSLLSVWPFSAVLCVLIYTYAVLGMQLFGGKLLLTDVEAEEGELLCGNLTEYDLNVYCPQRANYDSIGDAIATTFQILTGENWNEVMYASISSTSYAATVYFISLVLAGNYVVLSLFLAILIDAFTSKEEYLTKAEMTNKAIELATKELIEDVQITLARRFRSRKQLEHAVELVHDLSDDTDEIENSKRLVNVIRGKSSGKVFPIGPEVKVKHKFVWIKRFFGIPPYRTPLSAHPSFKHRALNLLSPVNPFRRVCAYIADSAAFESIILATILLSCTVLALDTPRRADLHYTLSLISLTTSWVFVLEAIIKICAHGFVEHEGSYLRDPWNRVDFAIVLTSVLDMVLVWQSNSATSSAFGLLKIFRVLRAFRPLRLIRRLEGLKVVVHTMIRALPNCLQVFFVCALFYMVFAIIARDLFGGMLLSCNDSSRTCKTNAFFEVANCPSYLECVGSFNTVVNGSVGVKARVWENPRYSETGTTYSFDTVGDGMLTLFEVSTLENWLDVLYATSDITDLGHAPNARNSNALLARIFFIVFIMFSSFFLLNLFVSVIVDNFNKVKDEISGSAYLTENQKRFLDLQKLASRIVPDRMPSAPLDPFRRLVFRFVQHHYFDMLIVACIGTNVLILGTKHFEQDQVYTDIQTIGGTVFYIVFLVEALLKLIGLGIREYFYCPWNRFDFSLVVISTLPYGVEFYFRLLQTESIPKWTTTALTLCRLLRVARLFRFVRYSDGLRTLLNTLVYSLPALGNVAALTLLVFFIFAVIGINAFSYIPHGDFIDDYNNFETFHNAMILLFRCSTGESWNGLMHEVASVSWIAYPFFLIFVLLSQFCFLPLLIGVLLENFEQEMEYQHSDSQNEIKASHITEFKRVWRELRLTPLSSFEMHLVEGATVREDSTDALYLPAIMLADLVDQTSIPLGLKQQGEPAQVRTKSRLRVDKGLAGSAKRTILLQLRVPIDAKGEINFFQVLRLLLSRVFKDEVITAEIMTLLDYSLSRRAFESMNTLAVSRAESGFTTNQLFAALIVQRFYRNCLDRIALAVMIETRRSQRRKSDLEKFYSSLSPIPRISTKKIKKKKRKKRSSSAGARQ